MFLIDIINPPTSFNYSDTPSFNVALSHDSKVSAYPPTNSGVA